MWRSTRKNHVNVALYPITWEASAPVSTSSRPSGRTIRSERDTIMSIKQQAMISADPAQMYGALAAYSRDEPNGLWRASGPLVITLRGGEVAGSPGLSRTPAGVQPAPLR
jgi:hypothetical protein